MRGVWCKNNLYHNQVCNAATSIANRITDYLTLIVSFYIVNCRNETHESGVFPSVGAVKRRRWGETN